jgi:O-antigen ligase
MTSLPFANRFDRAKFARAADYLAVAVAVSLPWSTSATGILLGIWLLALIPTLDWADVRVELMTAAGGLPVLLVLLGAAGMLWADVSFSERIGGFGSFIKLLTIPLFMVQFRRPNSRADIFVGFLASNVVLLLASYAVFIWPTLPKLSTDAGVIVKNYIAQSAEFTICGFALLYYFYDAAKARQWVWALAALALAAAFLLDIFFVATSRTSLIVIPVLVLALGARQFGWKGFFGAAAIGLFLVAALWMSSGFLRVRVYEVLREINVYETANTRTSSGERLEFWKKSLTFVAQAPVIGHGTGTITYMFRRAAVGKSGVGLEVSSNPHNQTFAVAIQLGLVGAVLLYAMWASHLLLFRGGGLVGWIGLVVVTQNIVGSLFNSYLFDFTEGWIYVIGFGAAAGLLRRQSAAA